jgi:radical SAM superfamily enzyme YgiQ (UPF0313 family)
MEFEGIYLKESSIILSDKDFNLISYDWEGRWYYSYIEGFGYRKGLNGKILKKKRPFIKELDENEKREINEKVYEISLKILKDKKIKKEKGNLEEKEAENAIKRGIKFWEENEKKFYEIYSEISILPPDQYFSIYLQVVEGCNYGKCIFCNFYRKKYFKIKNKDEFEEHIKKVYEFIGKGLSLRKTIFLGDANAILLPEKNFLKILEIIRKYDNERKIYSFMDIFTGIKRSKEFFKKIKEYGVERLYIGLETGSKKLLNFLEKNQDPEDFKKIFYKLKDAGINVGIIIMIGIGGDKFYEEHINETVKILKEIEIGKNDIIYFSDFVIFEDLPYVEKAKKENIKILNQKEIEKQKNLIYSFLIPSPSLISFYNVLEFIY